MLADVYSRADQNRLRCKQLMPSYGQLRPSTDVVVAVAAVAKRQHRRYAETAASTVFCAL